MVFGWMLGILSLVERGMAILFGFALAQRGVLKGKHFENDRSSLI